MGRIEEVELPKGCGHGQTPVYYLTTKGAAALARVAPSLARQPRPGRPRGANRARIPHELLVAEAYLWVNERYEIFEFWPETELKRRIGRARASRDRGFVNGLNDEAMGGFKALVIARSESKEEQWIHGEVVVHYDARQVKGKPGDALWFTRDPRYVDIVEYIKGRPTVLLGDVRAPLHQLARVESRQKDGNLEREIILTPIEQRTIRAVSAVGGLATAEALALIVGNYRTPMSRTLKSLEAKGKLLGLDAQLVPGCVQGRPMRVYVLAGSQPVNVRQKIKGLIRSRMVVEMAAAGYRFFAHKSAKDQMAFRGGTGSRKPTIIVVVDAPEWPVEHLAERIKDV